MKIALPTKDDRIDSHFGHCDFFTVVTINEEKEIEGIESIPSPVGCGCKSNIAGVLSEKGVSLMLAGNMGQGAVNVLKNNGIEVVRGCSGTINDVMHRWINGTLEDNGLLCQAHHSCEH